VAYEYGFKVRYEQKEKKEVYMCELENGGWESPGKKTKK
jgi:hypothetical protein